MAMFFESVGDGIPDVTAPWNEVKDSFQRSMVRALLTDEIFARRSENLGTLCDNQTMLQCVVARESKKTYALLASSQ